jgi:pyruvate,orthophosphate dikinase
MAVEKGRQTRKQIKLGICGEHGGDQQSVFFCEQAGLDYVSCSPPRVPIARLAAAQAVTRSNVKGRSPRGTERTSATRGGKPKAKAKPAARSTPKAAGSAARTKKARKKRKGTLAFA